MPVPDDKSRLLSRFKDNSANLLDALTAQRLVKGDVDLAKKLISSMELVAIDPTTAIITQGGADDELYFILAVDSTLSSTDGLWRSGLRANTLAKCRLSSHPCDGRPPYKRANCLLWAKFLPPCSKKSLSKTVLG